MAVTGQIYYLGQGSNTDGRLAVFNNDGTSQVVIADNTPAVDLVTQFPQEVGVDTAAGYYFALVNGGIDGSGAYLVRGLLSGGAATVVASFDAGTPGDSADDPIVNALQVDVFSHKIYVGVQAGDGATPGSTGIQSYDYSPTTGAVTGGSFITTVTSSGKPQESGLDIFNVRDFALNRGTNSLFFAELLTGIDVEGVWRVDLTSPNTVAQVVDQAQFPDDHSNGYIIDVEVDSSTGLLYFGTQSQQPSGNAGYNAAQNAIWYIAGTATGGTATQLTLNGMPGGNAFYPHHITLDPQTRILYVTSEETDVGGAVDDRIYAFALSPDGTSATWLGNTSASPAFTSDTVNFGGLVVNDIPKLLSVTGTSTHAVEQGAAVTLLTGAPTITDTDGSHLSSATVVVGGAGNFQFNDDVLAATTTGTNITASFNAATETLTLTGYDTLANYQTVLATVRLNSTGDNPTNYGASTTRTITFTVSDGAVNVPGGSQNSATTTITIDAVNDAPANTVGATAVVVEDASNTAITGWSILDVDANPASAVMNVVVSVSHGTLSVSTPGGGSVTGSGTASVTITGTQNAINAMIAASGVTYTPTANFNGSDTLHIVTSDDGTTGTGGVLSDTDDKAISITAVNDAPTVVGDGTEDSIAIFEDQPSATGQTISTLFAGQYSDALDNQIPNGGASSPGAFSGVAVVANGSSAGTGQWQWLNGATWTDIGTVSLSSAKLFANTTAIRFNPAANYNGAEPTLTVHLIDNALGFGITNAQVVNISGVGATGGTTAYSTGSVVLGGTVSPVNDAPTSSNLQGNGVTWTEGFPAVRLDTAGDAIIADIDSADFAGGTLTVAIASPIAQDGLFIAAVGTVTSTATTVSVGGTQIATYTGGGFGGSSLVFTLDADATPAAISALVHAINYDNNAGDSPTPGNRVINWTLVDGDGIANGGTDTLTNATTVAVVETNDAPVANDDAYTIAEDTVLSIPMPFDELVTNDTDADGDPLRVTSVTNAANGTLSVVGSNLLFTPTANYSGPASFDYFVTDDRGGVDKGTVNITITAQNDAPSIGGLGNQTYNEGATLTIAPALTVDDPDNANLTGATVTLADPATGDALAVAGALPGGITLSGTSTASSIVLTGTASVADYQAALRQITFANSTDNPSLAGTDNTRIIQITATDGAATSSIGQFGIAISAVNDAPVNSVPGVQTAQQNGSLTFSTANSNAISISDVDAGGANVTLTLTADHGTLALGSAAGLFSVSGDGTATVTAVGTLANLNAALQGLTYTFTSGYSGPAGLDVLINDGGNTGTGGSLSDTDTIAITVVANNAPVLDALKTPVLNNQLEDSGAPSGAVGTLVSALVDNTSPVGGLDNVTDTDGPALGIAITGAATASGTWHFSTNNGSTWTPLGAVSDATARLLSADANTRVYFQPNANFNGTLSTALTFRAWDGFTGTNGTTANTTTNGGATAFSIATDTAALTITPVNDAPVVTTSGGSASYAENGPGAPIDSALTVTDIDSSTLFTASVRITPGTFLSGQDILSFSNSDAALFGNVSASYDSGTGVLSLASAGGTATLAQWQAVLRSVRYSNTSESPVTTDRQMEFSAGDGNLSSAIASRTVSVTSVADFPSITNAITNEDTQSTTGLVVTRNAVDGAEVTHFKITGITGGTLFQNDGTTAIANNSFITFAEANAGLKFTPTANSFGSGSFDVQGATSAAGAGLSPATFASITVNPVADAPSITGAATNEDTQSTTGLVISRNAVDGAEVTHFKITGITNGQLFLNDGTTQVTNGSFITFAQANAGLKFTPDPDFSGNGTFNVQASLSASDAGLGGAVVPATITVAAVNDAPFISMIGEVTTNEDTAFAFSTPMLRVDVGDVDAGSNPVQVTLTSTHGVSTLSDITGLTFTSGDGLDDTVMTFTGTIAAIDAALLSLSFKPDANFNGDAKLEGAISDQGSAGSGGVLTGTNDTIIHVTSVNDAPAGTNNTVSTAEDTPYAFATADFGFSDPVDSPGNTLLGVKVTTLPGTGSLLLDGVAVTAGQTVSAADITAGKLRYAPPANANGAALSSFTFQVQDNGGTANGGIDLDASANTMTLTVTAVNDAPVNTVPATASTNEDVGLAFTGASTVSIADVDAAASPMQVTLGVAHGSISLGTTAGLSFTTGDGTGDATMTFTGTVAAINTALAGLVYAPVTNFSGGDTLTITTNDQGNTGSGGALSDTDSVAITVNAVNDAPVAPATRSLTISEDTSTGAVAIGASDVDGDLLTYTLQAGSGPLKGAVAFNQATGTFTYTPIANANGADSFIVTISDGKGGITQQQVGVAITPANDAPVAVADTLVTVEGTAISVPASQLTANDSDVDGDPLVVASVFGASGGAVSQVGSTITFTPSAGFSGVGGFNYTLSDTNGATATARVTVEVGAINHAPVVATNQSLVTLENIGRVFTVAASDADGDPLTFILGTAAHGTITTGGGGVFTYLPAAGYLGADSFTVTVSDGRGGSATQTIDIAVVDLPDATGFRLFTTAGWTGAIGGSGTVGGTNGHERVEVIDDAGTIVFDGSFSRGNDVIVLDGAASAWAVVRHSASIALFSDGDTFVEVPVGATGTAILFDDGARTLAFTSAGAMTIGGQTIGTTLANIAAAPSPGSLPGGDDAGALARLFLAPGSETSAGGHLLVIGTNSAETLHLADGDILLDGSFTRGNDTLVFDFAASTFQASRNGAQLNLTGNGLDLTTPVGTGVLLDFTDSDRVLTFTGPDMTIGSQTITSTTQFLIA